MFVSTECYAQVIIFTHICNNSITQKVCKLSGTTIIMKWLRDKVKVISGNIFQYHIFKNNHSLEGKNLVPSVLNKEQLKKHRSHFQNNLLP